MTARCAASGATIYHKIAYSFLSPKESLSTPGLLHSPGETVFWVPIRGTHVVTRWTMPTQYSKINIKFLPEEELPI